jgi:GT2 family glycosyltransferase
MSLSKAYILILNWHNWRDTIECLESVLENSYPDYRTVVIDNGSTDGSEEKITQWVKGKAIAYAKYDRWAEKGGLSEMEIESPIVFIQTGENIGYAGGNNVGIKYALKKDDCKYIWLLNNDTIIDKKALSEMVECIEADEKIGMVGSKLLYHDRPDVIQAAGGGHIVPWMGNVSIIASNQKDVGSWDEPFETSYISGASLLVKKEVIDAVGLMDEKYFLYWEDSDWGTRARRKGYRNLYCPKSKVWHKEGGTSGYLSLQADYYWVRNGLYFTKKFYPFYLPLVPFSYLAKYTLVRALKRQPFNLKAFMRGITDFLRGKTGPI